MHQLIKSLALSLALLTPSQLLADEYKTLVQGKSFSVPSGKTAMIIFHGGDPNDFWINFQPEGSSQVRLALDHTGVVDAASSGVISSQSPLPLVGPSTISIPLTPGANSKVLGLKIVDTIFSSKPAPAPSLLPSNAVVIPADAAGPVQIILESSTDLVTWTAITPGTYAAETTERFFRVRAVQN